MKTDRKIYDRSFKIQSVELSNEIANVSELAKELGIRPTLLYKWRKEQTDFGQEVSPAKGI